MLGVLVLGRSGSTPTMQNRLLAADEANSTAEKAQWLALLARFSNEVKLCSSMPEKP